MNLKTVLCAAGGMFISLVCAFDRFLPVILWVISFSALDFVTGLIKGKIHKDISSKRAFEGFWKKLALISALFLGILLDFALPSVAPAGEYAQLAQGMIFSGFIGFYIVISEAISITENLYGCGVPLPKFIVKFLGVCRDKIDNEEDDA